MQNNNDDTFAFQKVSTILGLLEDVLHIEIDSRHSGSIAITPYLEERGLTVLALSHKQHSECGPCSCWIGAWCIQHFRLKEIGFLLFNVHSFHAVVPPIPSSVSLTDTPAYFSISIRQRSHILSTSRTEPTSYLLTWNEATADNKQETWKQDCKAYEGSEHLFMQGTARFNCTRNFNLTYCNKFHRALKNIFRCCSSLTKSFCQDFSNWLESKVTAITNSPSILHAIFAYLSIKTLKILNKFSHETILFQWTRPCQRNLIARAPKCVYVEFDCGQT